MAPMYRLGTAAVLDGPMAAEAKFVQVTAIGGSVPVAVVSPVVLAGGGAAGRMLPCADGPDLFFAESPDDVELAKSLCGGCPVRTACLAGAVQRREPWGVWGGELFLRGETVPRKRARGRPRKNDVAA
jgi:WhiB family transcriptional regulator, redox-sensing transcriptional regulator